MPWGFSKPVFKTTNSGVKFYRQDSLDDYRTILVFLSSSLTLPHPTRLNSGMENIEPILIYAILKLLKQIYQSIGWQSP